MTTPNPSRPNSTAPSAVPIDKQRNVICPGHSRPVVDVRFCAIESLPSCILISASHDKLPMMRWGDNGNWIGTFKGHQGAVWSAALNETATLAATGSADFSVKIWDAIHGKEMQTFTHAHVMKAVDFSPNGKRLLCGGLDKLLCTYDLSTGVRDVSIPHDGTAIQKALWMSQDLVVSGGGDGAIRLFDVRTTGPAYTTRWIKEGVKKPVADLEFSSSSSTLLAVSGRRVILLDPRALHASSPRSLLDTTFDAEAASLSPNGETMLVGGSDLWLHVFELQSMQEIQTNKGHHGPIFCVRYDPMGQGKRAASGAEDGTVRLWGNLATSVANKAS